MPKDVYENWPDFAALSACGEGATLCDDMGRSSLTVSIVKPYWYERALFAHDQKTGREAQVRLANPFDRSCQSPHTLRAVYSLQAALVRDAQITLGAPGVSKTQPVLRECVCYSVTRTGERGFGALSVQRLNRNWLGLTVVHEDILQASSGIHSSREPDSVTVLFNRMRSPHVYGALLALGQAIRRDNKEFPRAVVLPNLSAA